MEIVLMHRSLRTWRICEDCSQPFPIAHTPETGVGISGVGKLAFTFLRGKFDDVERCSLSLNGWAGRWPRTLLQNCAG